MKSLSVLILLAAFILAGCGKDEPSASTVAETNPDTPAATEPAAPSIKKELETQVETAVETVKASALAAAESVDWANLSWNDVSKVPYNDKEKLLQWATPQIDELKDKLAKAALEKGKLSLAGLGDSGWQGAIKDTVSALDKVRTSSPETWAMATGALSTAWEALQAEASKYLGAG